MLTLVRVGYYVVAGHALSEARGVVTLRVEGQLVGKSLLPMAQETVEVRKNLVIRSDVEGLGMEESAGDLIRYESLLHQSLMPSISSMRDIPFVRNALVAYERGARGIGFLDEAANDVRWIVPTQALRHSGLGNLLALEALRPRLVACGIAPPGGTGRADRIEHVIEKPSVHVYMKSDPFRDITKLYRGTRLEVRKYYRGCALVEADGEPFWYPVDVPYYVLPNKDDAYYFTLDADQDNLPDPLSMLPSKLGLRSSPGSARPADNWCAAPDMSLVAGNFYATSWLGKAEDVSLKEAAVDPATAIASGVDIDALLLALRK